jgi:hydroxymethylpyrimidine/phosphomethylpyrimidine kinase
VAHFSFMHIALTIAGSDSGGGAGIQADLKTFFRFGVYGTSAITAVTAQNTVGVSAWDGVSPELLRAQIDAIASDLPPTAVKTGMIGTSANVQVVADALRDYDLGPYVLDPVIVATSGDDLLARDAVAIVREQLLPQASLVTPNASEVRALTDIDVVDENTMRAAAEKLVSLGARAALIKGGHIDESSAMILDVFYDGEFTVFSHARLETKNTHGTGCTLSAAITAQLAANVPMSKAVEVAIDFVHSAIRTAPSLGAGHGPLNHFAAGKSSTNDRTTD